MNDLSSTEIPLAETNLFSNLFLDYLKQADWLQSVHEFPLSTEGLLQAAQSGQFSGIDRETLAGVLEEQYASLAAGGRTVGTKVIDSIRSLRKSETFTITTGQQLHPATGPLYVVFKALSVLHLCRTLNNSGSGLHFVPVFWMASEDHDLAEIRDLHLFGKTLSWVTSQAGATGRMHCEGLPAMIEQLSEWVGNRPGADTLVASLQAAYAPGTTLADATRRLLNDWFGEAGLVVLDPDHPKLKRLFTEVMLRDVQLQEAPEAARPMEKVLSAHGKVPLSIRPINLFYLGDTYRLRIDPVRNGFRTADERFRWSAGELEEEINSFPERFSPNVVLRPLYQQRILPNIAYVGGPAEIVYWLQLRPVFSLHQTAYPVLVPRAHGALLESTLAHRFERLGFRGSDWLASAETLTERFIAARGVSSRPFDETMEAIAQRMQALTDFVEQTDKTLGDAGRAETARIRQSIDRLQEKWTKAVKRQEEQSLQQIRKVRERLFPTGIPQERYENILGLIGTGSLRHPLDLLEFADPLKRTFSVIRLGSHDQLHHAGEQQDA